LQELSIGAAAASAALVAGCVPGADAAASGELRLKWQEFFKKNYQLMTEEEKAQTVARLEKLAALQDGLQLQIGTEPPLPKVLYGYAFNITRCEGFMECVTACIKENNLDRRTNTQYIRIFEMEPGQLDPSTGDGRYFHEVPVDNKFYMGTQCFHCENAPCTKACPVQATWKEPDGIVVVDYDWCIGCRYCQAACPYDGRRFNWASRSYPKTRSTPNSTTSAIACARWACREVHLLHPALEQGAAAGLRRGLPHRARVFGNLLDPDSEIRYVLKHKKVFSLKEELGTEPKFWYFID
jgi:Fe-S-cluster-containing dehydrogenase component